jgi:hypothetical protein
MWKMILLLGTVASTRWNCAGAFSVGKCFPRRAMNRMPTRKISPFAFITSQRRIPNSGKHVSSSSATDQQAPAQTTIPLYRSEGMLSIVKPLGWTSSDVVSFIRKMLERDARDRGAKPVRVGSRRNKSRIIKVGHGGTLDPLATGVLVIGVGKGTKDLKR